MTIAELIDKLSAFEPDLIVRHEYDCWYPEVEDIEVKTVKADNGTPCIVLSGGMIDDDCAHGCGAM